MRLIGYMNYRETSHEDTVDFHEFSYTLEGDRFIPLHPPLIEGVPIRWGQAIWSYNAGTPAHLQEF